MMKIGELCERDVVVATPETTIAEAATLMRQQHVGCIVVVDRQNGGLGIPRGVVTDRDIVVEITATGLDPKVMTVGDIMTRELVTIRADDGPLEAMRLMRVKGVRRLPVVTQNGHLIGLVAFDDLLEVVTDELSDLTKTIGREQAREAAARR
jgi:CBS domain-containing protein